jgi:hypothetical protein
MEEVFGSELHNGERLTAAQLATSDSICLQMPRSPSFASQSPTPTSPSSSPRAMAAKQAAFWPLFFLLACAWILLLS